MPILNIEKYVFGIYKTTEKWSSRIFRCADIPYVIQNLMKDVCLFLTPAKAFNKAEELRQILFQVAGDSCIVVDNAAKRFKQSSSFK